MTQPQTLSVEYEELMARADELEAPIPGLPTENPQAPCVLPMVITAADQLALSADNMRIYLEAGEREWEALAESLRNAAKAYEEVDTGAAAALDSGDESVSGAATGTQMKSIAPPPLTDTQIAAAGEAAPFRDVKEAAQDISEPDQGVAFTAFADAWTGYQRALLEAAYRFRPFESWEGDARYAVEANFDQQRAWLYQMADLCGLMATQARGIVSTQDWALPEHPTVQQVEDLDYLWYQWQTTYPWKMQWSDLKPVLEEEYVALQEKSEQVLAEYEQRAALPLPPISPPLAPAAGAVVPPIDPGAYDFGPGAETPYPESPYGDLPQAEQLPELGGMPSAATAAPPTDATLGSAAAAVPDSTKPAGMKPASSGGTGIPPLRSVPSMPLQAPAEGGGGLRPAPAALPPTAMGRGVPGAAGAMGAGGMGVPPVGAQGGHGQQPGKGKRRQADASIYSENRAWTEAIIGRRRPKDAADH
ncbi:putative alanine and glycine rich protein [Mycobacterium lentiflavum]|uniref:Putative alanine and glycine rich protein n=1 Tax=Mycobacterium lentiflavum TaxID=141349 RepID=A0A0E3WB03_MYCLN|nr:hypothetical protein [Mycobacterium lentiflavum]CQD03003.1 putative alanine and glycine rich protein [Mycobacterium lentiflavum]